MLPDIAALAKTFDYMVPERWAAEMAPGTRVRIRLHGRAVGAWVLETGVEPPAGLALQSIRAVSGLGPDAELIALADWAAWRWAGPKATFLAASSPARNVTSLPTPPPWSPLGPEDLGSPAGDLVAQATQRVDRPTLVRLAPTEDLLALVLAVLSGVGPGLLVLVPSAGWATRLAARLTRRGVPVAADWAQAAAGWPVVVGSRAVAFARLADLSAVVALDAHDEAYQDERAPTFNAVEVVAERARRAGVPCVAVSSCPTLVQVAESVVVAPGRAVERAGWPALQVVDLRVSDPRQGLLSEEFTRFARGDAEPTHPLVCVLNRTGRAKLLACATCGELARCEQCGRAVAQVDDQLVCPGCGLRRPVVCGRCGASVLKVLRPGISRLRDDLEALLAVPVAEVAGPRGAAPDAVGTAPVLIGTEAVLHRVRRAEAVAFLDFDQQLLAPRFVAAEQALALLARAARLVTPRSGAAGPPRVLVQTRLPDHEVLQAARLGDPDRLRRHEEAVRRPLALPPFAALALLSGAAAPAMAEGLAAQAEVEVAAMGEGRFVVRAADHRALCDALAATKRPAGRLRVAVDPTEV